MLNSVPTSNVTISLTSGTSATGFSTSTSGGATATPSGNGPGAIPPSGNVTVGLTNATGSYSGTVQAQTAAMMVLATAPAVPAQGKAMLKARSPSV